MLSEFAFANSLAILTALLYVVFLLLGFVAHNPFKFLFNAQFLGADVASLFPERIGFANAIGTLIILVLTSWGFGYAWAWLYNKPVPSGLGHLKPHEVEDVLCIYQDWLASADGV